MKNVYGHKIKINVNQFLIIEYIVVIIQMIHTILQIEIYVQVQIQVRLVNLMM